MHFRGQIITTQTISHISNHRKSNADRSTYYNQNTVKTILTKLHECLFKILFHHILSCFILFSMYPPD